jgi:hypothetical protein
MRVPAGVDPPASAVEKAMSSDREKLAILLERLWEMRHAIVPEWQRPIQVVACEAIETEIATVGRRLARYGCSMPTPQRRVAS